MKTRDEQKEKILELARPSGVVTAGEVRSCGIHHEYLRQMCVEGDLVRVGRGLYSLPGADTSEHHGFVLATKAIPNGVVCLLSSLRFHEIGTQAPFEVWMALDRRAAYPRSSYPKTRIVRFSGDALLRGVRTHILDGIEVKIYDPAKTVADCFKYRNKIGLDVAIEALREVLRSRKCTIDELWKYAKICRVSNVIRPYLEASV
jgi:predicted transcriptional regulator of viral defense system